MTESNRYKDDGILNFLKAAGCSSDNGHFALEILHVVLSFLTEEYTVLPFNEANTRGLISRVTSQHSATLLLECLNIILGKLLARSWRLLCNLKHYVVCRYSYDVLMRWA